MGDDATLARAAALLGVLVHCNEPPDMIEIDSKEKLFNSTLRLGPNNLLALLCDRLGVPAPATLKRSGPWDGLLEGVAAHFGWSIGRTFLFSNDEKTTGQPWKMEQWIRTASFTPEAVDELLRDLEEENDDVDDENGQEDDEDEGEKYTPRDAVGTMKGVSVARAGAAAVQKMAGNNSDAAAGGERVAEEEVGEKGADEAAKAAEVDVAEGTGGPAKEKEEVEESDTVPGSDAKEDTAAGGGGGGGKQDGEAVGGSGIDGAPRKVIVEASKLAAADDGGGEAMEEEIPSPAQEKVLLSGKRWSFLGDSWADLSNGLEVCDGIVDSHSGTRWTRGQTVLVQHGNVPNPHHGIVVAVGRCSDKPYIVLYRQTRFEQTPISKEVKLVAGAPAVASAEVEQLWLRYCAERMASGAKQPKVAKNAKVEKPQRVQPPRAAKGEAVGKKRSARKVQTKRRRKVTAVDEGAEAANDEEEQEEEEEVGKVTQKKREEHGLRSKKPKRDTSKPKNPSRSRHSRSRSRSRSPSPKEKRRRSPTRPNDDDYERNDNRKRCRSRSRSRSRSRDGKKMVRTTLALAALANVLLNG
jgi:hypothetical protein